jgi:hypothetical protein
MGNAVYALGITLDGMPAHSSNRVVLAALLLSGTAKDTKEAFAIADRILAGR